MPIRIHPGLAPGTGRFAWSGSWRPCLFVLYIPTRAEVGTIGDMTLAFQMATAAMALNLVMGYGGLVSLGFSAYFGLGGYTMAVLVDHYGWSQGWTLYIAADPRLRGRLPDVAAGAASEGGLPRPHVTLGLAVLFPQLIKWQKLEWLTEAPGASTDLQYDDIPKWPILGELSGRRGRAVFMFWLAVIVLVALVPRVPRHREEPCRALADRHPRQRDGGRRDGRRPGADEDARVRTGGGDDRRRRGAVRHRRQRRQRRPPPVHPRRQHHVRRGHGHRRGATLWGPIVGAILYVFVETDTREWGAVGDGLVGWLFGWLRGSPATFILAVLLLVLMFVAPFGIIGLLKRLAVKVAVIVPSPAGTRSSVPAVEEGLDPSIDEPFLPISTEETSP